MLRLVRLCLGTAVICVLAVAGVQSSTHASVARQQDTHARHQHRKGSLSYRKGSLSSSLAGWGSMRNKIISQRISADNAGLKLRGIVLSAWGPDPKSGKVIVFLTHYSWTAKRALLRRYGSTIVVYPHSTPQLTPADRYNDKPSFLGGDQIYDTSTEDTCTAGPIVVADGTSTDYALTAGHCTSDNGDRIATGDNWTMGYVTNRSCADNSLDVAAITPYWGYLTEVWGGGYDDTNPPEYQEDGSAFPHSPDLVTSDGSQSGEITGITVDYVNMSADSSCGNNLTDLTFAHKGTDTHCVIPGDSGGPWFQHEDGTSDVRIVGETQGYISPFEGHYECVYTQIGAIDSYYEAYVPTLSGTIRKPLK